MVSWRTTSDKNDDVDGLTSASRFLIDQYQIPFNSSGSATRDALHFIREVIHYAETAYAASR
jgi:hypothetical protein